MSATTAYSGLRSELESIRDEAAEHRRDGVRLYHDLIVAPGGDPWDEGEYVRITGAEQKMDGALWESWEMWPERDVASRFWGQTPESKGYVFAFMLLLERITTTLDEFQRLADSGELLPRRVKLSALTNQIGFHRSHGPKWALELIHKWAFRFPTTRLLGQCRWWEMDSDAMAVQQFEIDEERPIHNLLWIDVFTALSAFLDMCLDPDSAVPVLNWDHLPELCLPDEESPARTSCDWVWMELASLSGGLRRHRLLIQSNIVRPADMSPHRIGVLIDTLEQLVQLVTAMESETNDELESMEIDSAWQHLAHLEVLFREFETLRAAKPNLADESFWSKIIDWVETPLSASQMREEELPPGILQRWLNDGKVLLQHIREHSVKGCFWPEIDTSVSEDTYAVINTVTWLGVSKPWKPSKEFDLFALLVNSRRRKVPFATIGDELYGDALKRPDTIRQLKKRMLQKLKQMDLAGIATAIDSTFDSHYWINEDVLLREALSAQNS